MGILRRNDDLELNVMDLLRIVILQLTIPAGRRCFPPAFPSRHVHPVMCII